MNLLRKIALAGSLCLTCTLSWSAPSDLPPKFHSCYQVYTDLLDAVGRIDPTPPELLPVADDHTIAEIMPSGKIKVGERFIDFCRSMGADSLNVMALVIGHELGHHFKEHFWAKEYGSAYAKVDWGKQIRSAFKDVKELGVYESQADEFGLFYSYLAGYNTLPIAGSALRQLYKYFELNEELSGYPTLDERSQIAELSSERVEKLIPVFEAGKLLNILATTEEGEYRDYLLNKASYCFEHIIDQKFASREMFNNLGLTYLLRAIGKVDNVDLPYLYPVVLDDESRLYDIVNSGNTKGGLGVAGYQHIVIALEDAEKYFKRAQDLDRTYIPSFTNLAISYHILSGLYKNDDPDKSSDYLDDAEYMASKAVKLATKSENDAMLAYASEIMGIIEASQGDKLLALQTLKEAKDLGSTLSAYNIAVVNGEEAPEDDETINLNLNNKQELIGGQSLMDIVSEADFYPEHLYKLKGEHRVIRLDEGDANLYVIDCTEATCAYNNVVFHQTKDNFATTTSRNIALGDDVKKMKMAYGKTKHIVPAAAHEYYVYPDANIIFKVSRDGQVKGWTVYFHI